LNWDEVLAIGARIPGLTFNGFDEADPSARRTWSGLRADVIWQRPLSKKDLVALGDRAPIGEVLAIHTADLLEKAGWLEIEPATCFDSPHFNGYPAVLVDLAKADPQVVFELMSAAAELPPKRA